MGLEVAVKTSTLRYYSFPVRLSNNEVKDKFSIVGVHIPSKHPLFGKREYLLYEKEHKKSVVAEHFLCINIITQICDTLNQTIQSVLKLSSIEAEITSNLNFILDANIPRR